MFDTTITEACDRRSLLRRIGLAAGAGGAAAISGPLLARGTAEASTAPPVLLGSSNTTSTFTQITSTNDGYATLWVVGGRPSGFNNHRRDRRRRSRRPGRRRDQHQLPGSDRCERARHRDGGRQL